MKKPRAQVITGTIRRTRAGRRGGRNRGTRGFLGVHTPRSAGRAANAEAGAQYNPAIREARQQAKGSRRRVKEIGSWYDQLAQDYGQSQASGQKAFETAQAATDKRLTEAGQRGQSELNELSAKDASLAALVGGPTDAKGKARMAAAGAATARSSAAATAPIATSQAAFLASLGGRRTSARMKGIEERREEGDRLSKIRSDIASTRKEKGQAKVSAYEKIREADRAQANEKARMRQAKREAAIQAKQAAAQLALSSQQNVIAARQSQERIGISRRNARTSERSQRATAKNYRRGDKGGLTPGERNTNKKELQNAASLVHIAVSKLGPPKNQAEAASLEAEAIAAGGSPRVVHRVIQGLLKGQRKRRSTSGYRPGAPKGGGVRRLR